MSTTDAVQPPALRVGERLGLPAHGAGSVAGWGRRIAALFVDWILASLAAALLVGLVDVRLSLLQLVAWFAEVWLLTALSGASAGQRLLALRVVRLDRRPVGLWAGLVRTLLLALVLPPVVADRDRRGLHDLAVGTVVVNGPRRQPARPKRGTEDLLTPPR